MSSRVRAYAYSNAFIRALKSRLLTTTHYDSMLKAKNEQEALRSLIETVYGNYMRELVEESLNIKKLDDLILKSFHDSYNRVINSIKDKFIKEVVSKIYLKHKFDYFKTIIKGLQNRMSFKEILEFIPSFLIQKDYPELLNSRSLEEFFNKIKNEELKEFLESMIKEYGKTKSIVLAEILADKHLYLNILEIIQKLKGIDKKVLESITGTEIDLMNMNLI
ncbi:MAG: V-type ATPase subunit, partial [Candidatus Bathyarchaeia archaeon]